MTQWGLDTLFNPAKRHMDEEKRRLQSTREEVGDNSGGKRIDLESGKVHIARNTDGSDDSDDTTAADAEGTASTKDTASTKSAKASKSAKSTEELSPAAARAAKRRARKS